METYYGSRSHSLHVMIHQGDPWAREHVKDAGTERRPCRVPKLSRRAQVLLPHPDVNHRHSEKF